MDYCNLKFRADFLLGHGRNVKIHTSFFPVYNNKKKIKGDKGSRGSKRRSLGIFSFETRARGVTVSIVTIPPVVGDE